jgi:hypothetical protein
MEEPFQKKPRRDELGCDGTKELGSVAVASRKALKKPYLPASNCSLQYANV